MAHPDSFGARSTLSTGGREFEMFRLDALQARYDVARLPYTLRVLLENVLRHEDGATVTTRDVEAVAGWNAAAEPADEINFNPARVLLQDFTGVPAVVDLAAMRAAMADLGGDPQKINPLIPVELVIDHSVQVDDFATRFSIARNSELEFSRNRERYAFLRWGQGAFANFKAVPPNTGICHQVNLEFLARVVEERDGQAFPDTVVGTDSHTTMVNGLGVLGWGVGGIEAEAAMLGEAISMLVPQVVGFRLHGTLPEGATATDLVLTVTQILRQTGVVGKFVEYFGHGLAGLPLADRATIGNMSPEYGATCGFFPVDDETLRYLRLTGRSEEKIALVEAYCRENGLWHDPDEQPTYSQVVDLDLSSVEPSLAGPRRPQDRVPLHDARNAFLTALPSFGVDRDNGAIDEAVEESMDASDPPAVTATTRRTAVELRIDGEDGRDRPRRRRHRRDHVLHEHVEPGRDDRRRTAREEGGRARPHAQAVGEVEPRTGLEGRDRVLREGRPDAVPGGARLPHGRLRLHDLHRELGPASGRGLAGDRRGRPRRLRGPLRTTATSRRGSIPRSRPTTSPRRRSSSPTRSRAGWTSTSRPSRSATTATARLCTLPTSGPHRPRCRRRSRRDRPRHVPRDLRRRLRGRRGVARAAGAHRRAVRVGGHVDLRASSSLLRRHELDDPAGRRHRRRPLPRLGRRLGDDRPHLPRGSIKRDSPAGQYLVEHGVERKDFNSYGSRRGNHEVMVRGTFANVRLRNLLVPGSEGTWTSHLPSGDEMTIFAAAERYLAEGTPHDRARGQGVRHRFVPRLGCQGAEPARREGGHRGELRADPPLEPPDDGDRARCSTSRARAASRSASPAARSSPSPASRTPRRPR